ncbi:hypothetical protein [Gilliamella apicola]|uniref:DUF4468 domain-containing protein n=1 Tax=Gilliamella apicola TaxID=1196095 RepID=X2H294_9GAMM|nr:hypothetical protein [Gilliamella apicola]AHN25162.1 hypothetical protein GAPWK_0585 [Gilliamella apicola]OTP81402.1 hypothetical protein B5S40_11605 [Gilliamella apicola]OTP83287.1 hypothetical protein B5S44_12510 [Gilliamella apicola]OTP97917.1 hypothetical protein B6D08_13000 [Gilliamella apicola]OTQ09360.1 hypothetical protein B6C91_09445 [Gilliamella apicola]
MKTKIFWGWLFVFLSFIANAKIVDTDDFEIIIYDSKPEAPVGRMRLEITEDYIVKYATLTCVQNENVRSCIVNEPDSKYRGNHNLFQLIPERFLTEDGYYNMQEYDGSGYKISICANSIYGCSLFSSNTPDRKDKDVAEFLDKIDQLLAGKSEYQFEPILMDK